jgi:hypothetical protein
MVKIQEATDKLRMVTLGEGRQAKSPIVVLALDHNNGFLAARCVDDPSKNGTTSR